MTLGDQVIITTETGRRIQGEVVMLRSQGDGRTSLILQCDAMIGGWAGTVPIVQDYWGDWVTLDGVHLKLEAGELDD